MSHSTPIVLSIAGSDSGAGAGIQADIKAISATGSYACTVITAITAQNTLGVQRAMTVPLEYIAAQLDALFSDLNVVAVKTGMLVNAEVIELVADKLVQYQPKFIIVDPVMIATSGGALLEKTAVETLQRRLLPLADLVTPNLPEAEVLTGQHFDRFEQQPALIASLRSLPAKAVLLKGGHQVDSASSRDWLITDQEVVQMGAPRVNTQNTHGTGCTLSAAIASYLAQGEPLAAAVSKAKNYLTRAIATADELAVGQGAGPLHHFFHLDAHLAVKA
ncbi:bifunctional hydroxymethylpyrimidine kinase/phosphomethylpyrimidine kinase [Vibrio sp.]|uniref:bifunctional hydroxymethylpyrimidine kinase/phosphomethylpyrimidine kinase n=1 Tax=Vibrio sp. TaxID=678 RepID=UPI003D149025